MDQEKDINQEIEVNNENSKEVQLHEIAIKMQEIEIALEQLEIKIVEEDKREELMPEYVKLQEQYKELKVERKKIIKGDKTSWDKVPVWIIIYAIIQAIILMPFVSYYIWMLFADWIIKLFSDAFTNIATEGSKFVFNSILLLTIYSLPLINFLTTWTLYVNVVKKDFEKKVFRWIWIVQIVLTIGLGIYLYFSIIKGNII